MEYAGFVAKLSGIYIKDEVIYFQLEIHNNSTLDYDIEWLKCFITDKKKSKRTAIKQNELTPLPRSDMNTNTLRERMTKADWYYDYTEDPHVWARGQREFAGIKKDLKRIPQAEAVKR